ncbi:MAG TPA: 3-hydroxyacyl-CoA dehydrogenase family protein [Puia sp.]|jgi:3-hydroxybutyryl-CoA dehydrogenase|nr:3-hydroxyacyl-CoA dehydrogenase family protein [Puia sp.]
MKVVVIAQKAAPVLFQAVESVVIPDLSELVMHRDADLYIDLDFAADPTRIAALTQLLPSPVIVNAVLPTIEEIGSPFIRINGWPGMFERKVHELAVPDAATAERVGRLYEKLGCSFKLAPDIPGMITARMLAVLINEAWYTWQEGVSGKEEIDTAMKLGTNYPMGPFEWGAHIGLNRVVGLLEVLSKTDSRYFPADSLKRAVAALKYD